MPYVNIKVTGGSEAPSAEQKSRIKFAASPNYSHAFSTKIPRRPSSSSTKSIWTTGAYGGKSVTVRRAEARNK